MHTPERETARPSTAEAAAAMLSLAAADGGSGTDQGEAWADEALFGAGHGGDGSVMCLRNATRYQLLVGDDLDDIGNDDDSKTGGGAHSGRTIALHVFAPPNKECELYIHAMARPRKTKLASVLMPMGRLGSPSASPSAHNHPMTPSS